MAWFMRRTSAACCALAVLMAGAPMALGQAKPKRAITAETITDQDVLEAIQKGIDYLLKSKKGTNWQTKDKYVVTENCGETALVLYSLMEVGEAIKDERLRYSSPELGDAVKWLVETTPDSSYSVCLHILAMSCLPDKDEYRKVLERDKQLLLGLHDKAGGVTYSPALPLKAGVHKPSDNSHVQYATLAAWALSEFGSKPIELPASYWPMTDRYWRGCQLSDGGWGYDVKQPNNHKDTMSLAGLASLFVTGEFIDAPIVLTPRVDKQLDASLQYVAANYKPTESNTYYMYNLERVGLAAGIKYFGTTDWYRQGALTLVREQNANGSWNGKFYDANGNTGTAYALLFLSRGRHPVLFNKLQYDGPWNARPRDDAFLTRRLARRFETPINWQIVNLKVDASDWLDAPVLLITGSQDPKFSDDDIAKLRAYIQAGGIIFSTADGDKPAFTDAMRKVAGKVVGGKYELRELPKDHPIFSEKLYGKVAAPPAMWGMSNGVRDIWFHSPVDMGASWQGRRYSRAEHWDIPTNIAFYASGKQSLQGKLSSLAVRPSKDPTVRSIDIGRLNYGDNWDPEPGAWQRMIKLGEAAFHTQIKLKEVAIAGPLDAKATPLIHFTGSTRFPVNADSADRLRAYMESGGMLVVDAAAGSAAFNESFVKLMALIYPGQAPEAISMRDPMLAGAMTDGQPIAKVEYRKYFRLLNDMTPRDTRLMGFKVKGRWAMVYSADDIVSGLLGTQTWGISGYTPDSAQGLMRNMILYAASPPSATAPKAATAPASAPATQAKPGK